MDHQHLQYGPVPETLHSPNVASVSSIHDSNPHSHGVYQTYHNSLGPPQPSDLWQQDTTSTAPTSEKGQTTRSPSTAPEVAQEFGFYQPQPQHVHRSMSPTLSQGSTNVGSPQLGSSVAGGEDKEVAQTYITSAPELRREKRRICGLTARTFWILLVILLLLIGLGVGLGVGLGLQKSNDSATPSSASSASPTSAAPGPTFTGDPNYAIGGVIDPAYYSTKGAFNGSGIAFAGAAMKATIRGAYTIYYQHYTGSIRYLQLTNDVNPTFVGGTTSEVVASDAKNSTPISVVQYMLNAGTTEALAVWHVFYVGRDGYIKQRTWKNDTNYWSDGPITAQQLKIYDADSVGLQACWYGNFYGDTAISSFPAPTGENNNVTFLAQYGMNLWYARDESTFEQYGIYEQQEKWVHQRTWSGFNGHAGVGCYSWLPGSTTYAMLVNQYDMVELWWKDTDQNLTSTEEHPINAWTNATDAAIFNVYPSTSLGFTTYFYAMLDDSTIHGYNISFNSQDSEILGDTVVSDASGPVKFLNGTHMSVSAVTDSSGGASLLVFAQTEGDDISLYTRDINGGLWTSVQLPVERE